MPRGGKRPGAGRKKGSPNKLTAELKAQAMVHAVAALENLGRLALQAESENAQIAAANLLLNRGFGRPGASEETSTSAIRIERVYRWARNETEATTDPSRAMKARRKEKK
jgi:hypothetical protein